MAFIEYTELETPTACDIAKLLGRTECAPGISSDTGDKNTVCITADAIKAVQKLVSTSGDAKTVIEQAKISVGCDSQACVVRKAKEAGLMSITQLNQELQRLKVEGPAHSKKLLINDVIDQTLNRFTNKWKDFHPLSFCMINFDKYENSLLKFNLKEVVGKGINTVACVLNTDVYGGRGKHWVCVFIDMRTSPWTVEYFNSSGRPPVALVTKWMQYIRNCMKTIQPEIPTKSIVVNSHAHQKHNTECGVYCLFYIISRLNSTPFTVFQNAKVLFPDKDMEQLRQFLFI